MKIKFTSVIEKSDNKIWTSHFPIPQDWMQKMRKTDIKRFICTAENRISYPCAIQNYTKDYPVIVMNKTILKKLKLDYGDSVTIEISEDKSEYGMPISEEFIAVMDTDLNGKKYFEKLTPGKQRALIYMISSTKNTDIRIRKSLIIFEHLKMNHGEIIAKELQQMLKNRK